jgi:hypothetical protein
MAPVCAHIARFITPSICYAQPVSLPLLEEFNVSLDALYSHMEDLDAYEIVHIFTSQFPDLNRLCMLPDSYGAIDEMLANWERIKVRAGDHYERFKSVLCESTVVNE